MLQTVKVRDIGNQPDSHFILEVFLPTGPSRIAVDTFEVSESQLGTGCLYNTNGEEEVVYVFDATSIPFSLLRREGYTRVWTEEEIVEAHADKVSRMKIYKERYGSIGGNNNDDLG